MAFALGSIIGATLALLILGAIFYGLLSLVPGLRTDARKLVLAAFLALGAAIVLAAFGMADGGPPSWERAFTSYILPGSLLVAIAAILGGRGQAGPPPVAESIASDSSSAQAAPAPETAAAPQPAATAISIEPNGAATRSPAQSWRGWLLGVAGAGAALAIAAVIMLSRPDTPSPAIWHGLASETDYARNYERRQLKETERFSQVVTVFDLPMTFDRRIGVEVAAGEYVDIFKVGETSSAVIQVRIDEGSHWLMSRQTFWLPRTLEDKNPESSEQAFRMFQQAFQGEIDATRMELRRFPDGHPVPTSMSQEQIDRTAFVLECSGVEYQAWEPSGTGEKRATTFNNSVVLRFRPGAEPGAQVEIIENGVAPGPLYYAATLCDELAEVTTCDMQFTTNEISMSSEHAARGMSLGAHLPPHR